MSANEAGGVPWRLAEQAARQRASGDWRSEAGLMRLIEIWCTVGRLLATLGRDGPFGDHWVLGSLMGRLGRPPAPRQRRRIAEAGANALAAEITALARELSRQTGTAVPVWTAEESQSLKRMLPALPARAFWLAGADALSRLGPACRARGAVLLATATAIWGNEASGN